MSTIHSNIVDLSLETRHANVNNNDAHDFVPAHSLISLCSSPRCYTVMTLSFRTDRSGQTVQTQIGLLLVEQSDQGLHCLLFHLHLLEENP